MKENPSMIQQHEYKDHKWSAPPKDPSPNSQNNQEELLQFFQQQTKIQEKKRKKAMQKLHNRK